MTKDITSILLGGLLTLSASGVVGYFHNDKALTERVAVTEQRQLDDNARMDRLEAKIDQIYRYIVGKEPAHSPDR